MSDNLAAAIREEQNIFKVFSSFLEYSKELSLFYSPDTTDVPHWNLVYPKLTSYTYSQADIAFCKKFYQEKNLIGHLLQTDKAYKNLANEVSEYFAIDSTQLISNSKSDSCKIISDRDFPLFVKIVAQVFNFNAQTEQFFEKKMRLFLGKKDTKFFVFTLEDKICGTLSSFRSSKDTNFLFNMAILPEYENLGLGTNLIGCALKALKGRTYIYSHNLKMRNYILPKLGFQSLGEIFLVPLNAKDFAQNSIYRN